MVAHWAPSETMDRASSTSKSAEIQSVPQPMDVQNQAPPPFLNKTYDMVDDPSTDSIVSWNAGGNGFVVWNSNEFQKELLPKYFKHNNFSSFVRQLNTYGFRKVDPDRWEFANEGFLRGQKHLLRSIQRKKPMPHSQAPQAPQAHHHPKPACVEVGKFGLEGEIERLKRDKNVLMAELVRLRQHQQQTDRDLQMVLQRLHVTEQRQQQMISFLAKAMQSPSFLAQLVQQNENKKRLATTRKKRRLPKQDGAQTESVSEEGSPEGQIVKYQPNSSDPMAMFMQYMNSPSEVAPKVELPSFFKDNPSGLTLTEMHTAQMAADLSPARMMKDLSDSMAAPTSPLSLMRFESVEGLEGGDSVEQQRDGEEISTGEEMTNVDFEWDQFLAQVQEGGIFESVDGNTWLEENGQVEQLAEQMDQLTS